MLSIKKTSCITMRGLFSNSWRRISVNSVRSTDRHATELFTEPPPRAPGVSLRVYVTPFCPFAQRVRLLLSAGAVPHESIFISLYRKPSWYMALHPGGQVPLIDHEGKFLRESEICFEYLNEVFSLNLWPGDPYEKAKQQIILADFSSKFLGSWFKYRGGDGSPLLLSSMTTVLRSMEEQISSNRSEFISGQTCGALDLLLWPFFERLRPTAVHRPEINVDFSEEKFPILTQWMKAMEKLEAVQSVLLPFDVHVQVAKSLMTGAPLDYSLADTDGKGITFYSDPPPLSS